MRLRIALAACMLMSCGCSEDRTPLTSGNAERGAAAIFRYGCGSCHTIAQLHDAHGLVGPPLTGVRDRLYVAGMLQNTPENLEHWIRDPKSVNPKTAMPNLGVTQQDATDIAAYLYSK